MIKFINYLIFILYIPLLTCNALAFAAIPLDEIFNNKLRDKIISNSLKNNQKTVEVSYQKQLALNIADEAINRIDFNSNRISKIIGNVSGFSSILSDDGRNLFITPRSQAGSKIDFAVLLFSGDIIDISLSVVKSKKPYLVSLDFKDSNNQNAKSEVFSFITAMKDGVIGKYYVQKSNNSNKVTTLSQGQIKATSGDIYRFDNLHGTALTLQNQNKQARKRDADSSINITENDLIKAFHGVVGVHIESTIIKPGEATKAYIVFKEPVA